MPADRPLPSDPILIRDTVIQSLTATVHRLMDEVQALKAAARGGPGQAEPPATHPKQT